MTLAHQILIFHDETDFEANGSLRGHILYLVPATLVAQSSTPMFGNWEESYSSLDLIRDQIMSLRGASRVSRKLHFTEISGRRWVASDGVARAATALAVDSMRSKRSTIFTQPLHCKMAILFFSSSTDLRIYGGESRKEKRLRHQETVLRMLTKGGLHYLYSEEERVVVSGLISDGDPFHRAIDDSRVMWRITVDEHHGRSPLRSNVSFARGARIEQIPSDHKEYAEDSQAWAWANLLQLSDLLLGSAVRVCHVGCLDKPNVPRPNSEVDDKKSVVAYPVKEMLSKAKRGRGFQRSGHYRSFSVSFVDFEGDELSFKRIGPLDARLIEKTLPLPLNSGAR